MWADICSQLAAATGRPLQFHRADVVAGGDINEAWRLRTSAGDWFVKLNNAFRHDMFEAERAGLAAMARGIHVPSPVLCGVSGEHAFLVLEWLDLRHRGDEVALGRQLAQLHRLTAPHFGWPHDNTIGATPQPNGWMDNWQDFFRERRLGHQFALAQRHGISLRNTRLLLDCLPAFLGDHHVVPSLLHGDLWGGNAAWLADGSPVLFDPACYYGDRETDLALTSLFGGFSSTFYEAYHATWPLQPGFERRRDLYNLYHMANHANMFGGGYIQRTQAMIDALIVNIQA
ncbi:fructosamine kinase family protein [Silvimonas amylolytica]|uniref:Fructosamine kinase family protein n=1 Tax=Silvimonas amylolytica TaxID=449663 RepID=A0ABQ2PR72_9NEIS|nr:fructosamine kinase family protein [Silvimonas amylolytica]GGP27841.1 fructosamine kinase family protein [Silvimonas amylolytica]